MRRKYLGPEVTLKIIQPNLLNLTDEEAKTPLKKKNDLSKLTLQI